jgi:hypothetical protein
MEKVWFSSPRWAVLLRRNWKKSSSRYCELKVDDFAKSHQRAPGKESENHAFRFPRSKKPRRDFLRPYQRGAQINGCWCKSLICKESEIWLYILSLEQKADNGLFATLS